MRNKAYFKADVGEQMQQRGQKAGRKARNTPRKDTPRATADPRSLPSGHHHRHHKRGWRQHPESHEIQIYLNFCRFWSPNFPRKHQSTPKIYSLLPVFARFCPEWMQERMKGRDKRGCPAICRRSIKEGIPPPICGATSALYPHNFSRQKYRKKSPQETTIFRAQNTEKSQPKGKVDAEKFSELFFGGMFRG